jgi:hypothetical protein
LKDDPANADLLERTSFLRGRSGRDRLSHRLTDCVLCRIKQSSGASGAEIGALAKKDYATVIKDVGKPSPGLFAALTNRVIEPGRLPVCAISTVRERA